MKTIPAIGEQLGTDADLMVFWSKLTYQPNPPLTLPRGPLVPSVDDCLDRYYTDLVPAEDVQRMRVMLGQHESDSQTKSESS